MNTKIKETNLFLEQPEVRRRIIYFFTEVDVYQWLLGVCSVIMGFFSKLSWDFFKKKNNNLNSLEKKVEKMNRRISAIEEGMIVVKNDGKRVPLSEYVHEDVKHSIDNNEKGVAGLVDMLLKDKELQSRINQQILIKLNQLTNDDK